MMKAIRGLEKPVVAMVNGLAYGGGVELAMAADFCIAAESATFCIPFAKVGLAAGLYQLTLFVNHRKATEMLFLGEPMSAREAAAIGLINRAVPDDDLEAVTMELAQKLAALPTKAIGAWKVALNRMVGASLDEIWHIANDAILKTMNTDDRKEGARAFLEKREPRFSGR